MDEPQNVYDDPRFYAGYEALRTTGSGLNDVLEQPALASVLPASLAGLRVLDLGCGFGDFARKVRALGASSVLGIDVSARMLERAAALTDDDAIVYRHAAIETLEAIPGGFDLVVSSLALHYVADYAAAVAKVAALLVPGGRFAFSVEHPICTALAAQRWIADEAGAERVWPVDAYRDEGPRATRWFVDGVIKYHRTIETYVEGLLHAGFALRHLREPGPVEGLAAQRVPKLDLHRRRPPFLVIAADR